MFRRPANVLVAFLFVVTMFVITDQALNPGSRK